MHGPAWRYQARWKFIGRALGIDEGTMEATEMSHHYDVNHCFVEIIKEWLNSPTPRQNDLDEALLSDSVTGKVHSC